MLSKETGKKTRVQTYLIFTILGLIIALVYVLHHDYNAMGGIITPVLKVSNSFFDKISKNAIRTDTGHYSKAEPSYHFISPPYGERPLEVRVLKDVCIEEFPNQNTSRVVVYNSEKASHHGLKTHGYIWSLNITWNVEYRVENIPKDRKIMPTPAFFFLQKFPSNLFHFFEDGIRGK